MRIIETPVFTKRIMDVLADDEYRELQWILLMKPESGRLTGGLLHVGITAPARRGRRALRHRVHDVAVQKIQSGRFDTGAVKDIKCIC